MPEYLFQIKGKNSLPGYLASSPWSFPPVWTDKVTAKDKKEAKELIEQEYGRKFPLRVLQQDLDSNEFLLNIKEIKPDDHHTRYLFDVQTCKHCGHQFKVIEKYQIGNDGGGRDYCSRDCSREAYNVAYFKEWGYIPGQRSEDYCGALDGKAKAIIYKITFLPTDGCYIGKTTQVFTLRWYQHFFQAQRSNAKFHEMIKVSSLEDWSFQIIEVIKFPEHVRTMDEIKKHIAEREQYYIRKYDSINNGFNSVCAVEEEEPAIQLPSLFE